MLSLLGSLTAGHVHEFMRRHEVAGRSKNKPDLLDIIQKEIGKPGLTWDSLIEYLDEVELYQKQHVVLMRAVDDTEDQWDEQTLKEATTQAGYGSLWGVSVRLAAPENLELASIKVDGDFFSVHAVGQRTYVHRNQDLERGYTAPNPDSEIRVYETVRVRAWARLELDLKSGNALIRCTKMPTKSVQDSLVKAFDELISPWFPMLAFRVVDLAKAISTLHRDEGNTPCEARVQEVGYRTVSGLQTVVKSSAGTSSISGHGAALDDAVKALRTNGTAARGVFHFLPPQTTGASASGANSNGTPVNPLTHERRVALSAADGVVQFSKATPQPELEHALRRIRSLAS